MTKTTKQLDEDLATRAAGILRAEADSLSGADRSRLNRSRQQALTELETKRSRPRLFALAPASGAVLASIVAAVVWFGALQTGAPELPIGAMPLTESAIPDDIDTLTVDENFELLEDLEFYNWLQSVPVSVSQSAV